MSLRTRLQVSITALVGVIVLVLSALYLTSVIETRFRDAGREAEDNAQRIQSFISELTSAKLSAAEEIPGTIDELRAAYLEIVEQEPELGLLLENLMGAGASPVIVEGLVTGPGDRILAASLEAKKGQRHEPLPLFEEFESKGVFAKLTEVFGDNQDYEVTAELGLEDEKIFTIRMNEIEGLRAGSRRRGYALSDGRVVGRAAGLDAGGCVGLAYRGEAV